MKHMELNFKKTLNKASRLKSAACFVFEQNEVLFSFGRPTFNFLQRCENKDSLPPFLLCLPSSPAQINADTAARKNKCHTLCQASVFTFVMMNIKKNEQ